MNSLNILLLLNSSLLILLILNQNESNKELTSTNSASTANPLEKFTWGCLFLQFVFFLIKTKTTDF